MQVAALHSELVLKKIEYDTAKTKQAGVESLINWETADAMEVDG